MSELNERIDEAQELVRAGGKWTGNEYVFATKDESDVAMLDDLLTDIARLARVTPAPQAAPSELLGELTKLLSRFANALSSELIYGEGENASMKRCREYEAKTQAARQDLVRGIAAAIATAPAVTQAAPSEPVAKPDYVLMPARLTAENGAKGALSGEFNEEFDMDCQECAEVGEICDDCEVCGGSGVESRKVPVTWDTIKKVYARAVSILATPAPAQQAEGDARDAALEEAAAAIEEKRVRIVNNPELKNGMWDARQIVLQLRAAIASATTSTEG
ncbi:hypothetical protein E7V67_011345 [[Empedobacter] haloabium]|uniref:Uncharacterized protein n=1 Tax=[Empedobacter] haloabium TaxID=592317 RepID=A0ABZ1UT00_9BURK